MKDKCWERFWLLLSKIIQLILILTITFIFTPISDDPFKLIVLNTCTIWKASDMVLNNLCIIFLKKPIGSALFECFSIWLGNSHYCLYKFFIIWWVSFLLKIILQIYNSFYNWILTRQNKWRHPPIIDALEGWKLRKKQSPLSPNASFLLSNVKW